jgi:DinB superfamily
MNKPTPDNYPEYFQRYINQVKEDDLKLAFKAQMPAAELFFKSISDELSNLKYAPDKWTIKEVLQHAIDTERIFSYRTLCIGRGEQKVLPGFDEKIYAKNAHAATRNWQDLIDEFIIVRRSTDYLYNSLSEDALRTIGNVNDYKISAAAVGFITVGHLTHHIRIIQERYLGV